MRAAAAANGAADGAGGVIVTAATNDGLYKSGITNGFYIGRPRVLALILRRFEELPGLLDGFGVPAALPAAPAQDRQDDYENALGRAFAQHHIQRMVSQAVFFKVRADGTFLWQGETQRWGSMPKDVVMSRKKAIDMVQAGGRPSGWWRGLPANVNGQSYENEEMLRTIRHLANWSAPPCKPSASMRSWGLCGTLRTGLHTPRLCAGDATSTVVKGAYGHDNAHMRVHGTRKYAR